jgi:chromosome segregation ATPase
MALDYEKIKRKKDEGNHWASYSDLFMVLSVVFLLLYVAASMRSGTFSLQKHVQYKQLADKAADLQEQIKVYETLKEDYMEKDAKKEDQEVYQRLMDKLTLLQEENSEEAKKLRAQAKDNEEKELALNEYQQMIRNIINANMLSQARIQKRDQTIKKNVAEINVKNQQIEENLQTIAQQDQELEEQAKTIEQKQQIIAEKKIELERKQQEIVTLEKDISQKQDVIEDNNQKIGQITSDLENKIKALSANKKKTKDMLTQISKLEKEKKQKIEALKAQNESVNRELASYQSALTQANSSIEKQQEERERLAQELTKAEQNLEATQNSYQQQINKLQSDHAAKMQAERIAFEKKLEGEKLTTQQKDAKLKEFQSEMARQSEGLKQQISGLQEKVSESQMALSEANTQAARATASLSKAESEKSELAEKLKKIKEQEMAKKQISETIRKNFAKVGVKSNIDEKTGEVTLSFGKEFFESGSSDLKPGMREVLEKFVPAYTKSLFQDPKIAEKIKDVEIVGHASPTYQGKFVNPNSLEEKDRKATAYNLDLSIKRAKSIFNHIFDTKKMNYNHQKELRGLIKVTGRGFFNEDQKIDGLKSGMKENDFCKKYDCKKAQRVIIKFNLKE